MRIKYFILLVVGGYIMFSCVPVRKFEDLKKKEEQCRTESEQFKLRIKELETSNNELNGQIERFKKEHDQLVKDTTDLGNNERRLRKQYDKILELNNQLLEKQKELVKGNTEETKKILTELQETQEDLQKREDELNELGRTLDKKRTDLDALRAEIDAKNAIIEQKNRDLEERNKRLVELEGKLKSMDSIVNSLKEKVSKALIGFEGDGLTVYQKNGKVYVSLDEKLLFKTASYTIEVKGKEALKKLTGVLEKNQDVNIMIEGHTDNVPYTGSGQLKDNWDLSVMRATSVAKILLEGSTIAPTRITSAGRSEYFPVDPANTKEAKAKNRRTEIILTPKLDELFKIIGTN
ncbi:MAG: OmpA family protein [Bacteroidia bacterium]|nr:OmpA family protein [Bacteroidia bacterium]